MAANSALYGGAWGPQFAPKDMTNRNMPSEYEQYKRQKDYYNKYNSPEALKRQAAQMLDIYGNSKDSTGYLNMLRGVAETGQFDQVDAARLRGQREGALASAYQQGFSSYSGAPSLGTLGRNASPSVTGGSAGGSWGYGTGFGNDGGPLRGGPIKRGVGGAGGGGGGGPLRGGPIKRGFGGVAPGGSPGFVSPLTELAMGPQAAPAPRRIGPPPLRFSPTRAKEGSGEVAPVTQRPMGLPRPRQMMG